MLHFRPWLCPCKKNCWENVSWTWSRPVSLRWVILCGSSGCSQSKLPASSCGQHRSNAGWRERGKIEVGLIHPCQWQVCFDVFVFFLVYLNPSFSVPGGTARWLHLSLRDFQGVLTVMICTNWRNALLKETEVEITCYRDGAARDRSPRVQFFLDVTVQVWHRVFLVEYKSLT